jgi:uncharacterized protein HemY
VLALNILPPATRGDDSGDYDADMTTLIMMILMAMIMIYSIQLFFINLLSQQTSGQ